MLLHADDMFKIKYVQFERALRIEYTGNVAGILYPCVKIKL